MKLVKHHLVSMPVDGKTSAFRKHFYFIMTAYLLMTAFFIIEECYFETTCMPLASKKMTKSVTHSVGRF
jgi:hypothetical protein